MTDRGLALLSGAAAQDVIATAVFGRGGDVRSWRLRYIDHQPGGRTTATYRVRVGWPDGSASDEMVGAVTGQAHHGAAEPQVSTWWFPDDPALPALAAAYDPERMRRLTAELGLGDGPVRLRVRTYRARRRAVIEVVAPAATVFVKVLRPARAGRLHRRHRMLAEAGCPVPRSLVCTDEGMIALSELPGQTLRAELRSGHEARFDPDDVVAVLDSLPPELVEVGPRRTSWGQRAPHYAEVIAAVAPELGRRAWAIAAAVTHDAAESPAAPVHGDFHDNQLMVGDGRISGLLDIDSVGCGERLDDAACLLGHLAVLAQQQHVRAKPVRRLARRLDRRFARDLPPDALARRCAAVVLSMATGPHRVQQRAWREVSESRIALAERLLAGIRS